MGSGDSARLCRHRGKYAVEYYDEAGRRRRRSLGKADRASAEAGFIEWKRVHSLTKAGGPLTVAAIYHAYALDREAAGKVAAPRIRDAWKRLAVTFEGLLPHQITKGLCLEYTAKRARTASLGTVHIELGYLRAALRFAEKENWLLKAPFVPLPSKPEPRDHRLTRDEVMRLRDAATMPHMRLFIILAITTAARAGAILDLTWDRVDLNRRRIVLRNPDMPTTNKGRATVPINNTALQALLQARGCATCDHVIEWGGKGVVSVKKGIEAAARRAGLICTPHVLRHSAAVLMAERGVPMEEIGQYLGHADVRTTYKTYARYGPDYLQGAAKALELAYSAPCDRPVPATQNTRKRKGAK